MRFIPTETRAPRARILVLRGPHQEIPRRSQRCSATRNNHHHHHYRIRTTTRLASPRLGSSSSCWPKANKPWPKRFGGAGLSSGAKPQIVSTRFWKSSSSSGYDSSAPRASPLPGRIQIGPKRSGALLPPPSATLLLARLISHVGGNVQTRKLHGPAKRGNTHTARPSTGDVVPWPSFQPKKKAAEQRRGAWSRMRG